MIGWGSSTFSFVPDFMVVKTQNSSVIKPWCKGFTVLSFSDFVDGDSDKMLPCPVRGVRK